MISSILFLGSQMAVGGAQRVLFTQALWFHNKGYEVIAAYFYDKENLKDEWEGLYPFPVIDLGARRSGANSVANFVLLVGGALRLWRLLRKFKIDVIETFTPDSNLVGLIVARMAGVPVKVASHHGYIEGAPGWRAKAHGWIVNHGIADSLVAVSERVRRIAVEEEGIRPDLVRVILNGIEPVLPPKNGAQIRTALQGELGLNPDDFVYLSVGRLVLQKGHTYLLEAAKLVVDRYPEKCVFLIAGEGHLRENLEQKVKQLSLDRVVFFLGNRPDIPDLLFLADVFVLPSLWEGLPLAVLEAMSAGLPVIATRVEGVEAVITDGENGTLLPSKDVQALADALIDIREDDNARRVYGEISADLVHKEFTVDRMCMHYEELFLEHYQQGKAK
jgi:glycosyltransferase involved in cell wall biosynthesis